MSQSYITTRQLDNLSWCQAAFGAQDQICITVKQFRSPSLYSPCTDRIENTSPNSSSIVASRGYRLHRVENTIPVIVYGYYVATAVVYRVII
jgi:hypothetical protein